MYCILTDGKEIFASATFINDEMDLANAKAMDATDGTFLWEAGSEGNVDMPKSPYYKHIKREDVKEIV